MLNVTVAVSLAFWNVSEKVFRCMNFSFYFPYGAIFSGIGDHLHRSWTPHTIIATEFDQDMINYSRWLGISFKHVVECRKEQNAIIMELTNSFMQLHNSIMELLN